MLPATAARCITGIIAAIIGIIITIAISRDKLRHLGMALFDP